MLFQSRYETVQATPIAVLDEAGKLTDERSYLVQIDGARALIDAETFDALYAPTHPPARKARRAKRARPRKVRARLKSPEPAQLDLGRGRTQAGIIAVLQKRGPLTTAELTRHVAEDVSVTRDSVYQTLPKVAAKGLIQKREEPDTRLDKWFIVEGRP